MQPLRLGFIAVGRSPYDLELANTVTSQVRARLAEAGFQLIGPQELIGTPEQADSVVHDLAEQSLDGLLVLQATFTDSLLVMRLAQVMKSSLILWAVPEARTGGSLRLNSLSGVNLAAHALKRGRILYETIYAASDNTAALEKVRTITVAGRVRRLLRGVIIGRIGEHPAGYEPDRISYYALRHQLGVNVAQIDLASLFAAARSISQSDIDAPLADLKANLRGLDKVDQDGLRRAVAAYLALRQTVKDERLNGLAVRCEPEFYTELGCTVCGPLSILASEGVSCSCECDVNATVTQLILQWIGSKPAFGCDMVSFEPDENIAVLWHCGLAPLETADPDAQALAAVHPISKLPFLMQFPFKPGRVTLARLSHATGEYRLVVASGEMLQAPLSFAGTSGVLRFDQPVSQVLETILSEGLENHVSLTYGDHIPVLLALARQLKIPVLQLA